MSIIVGSARHDERGKYSGGSVGDQLQTSSSNDTRGEVSMQTMYTHSKGWYILRFKNIEHANAAAAGMKRACNNKNIGYDQGNRLSIVTYGTETKVPVECDCGTLVRTIVKEVTGKDPGDFTTANEASKLEATGLFESKIAYVSQAKTPVYDGDILVTKTKGHTVIVVSGNPRVQEFEIKYEVQRGDTLSKIAAKYNTTYQKLAAYNGISNPSNINIGQIIKIPVASTSNSVANSTTATTQTATSTTASISLKIASNVKAVQTWLNTYYNTGLAIDGSFGTKSKAALIKAWQTEVGGLTVDGSFGPKSQSAASNHNIKRGSKGVLVTIWQAYLVCTGYNPNGIDGSFGIGCHTATVSFQKNKGLTQDGTVGKNTWTAAFKK